jgi:hypothetical protein
MSLLMKALEKAAKDRGEAQPQQPAGESPAAPAAAAPAKSPLELTLEPLQADAPAPPPEEPPAPPPRSATQTRAERNQARAATVLQATAKPAAATATAGRFRVSPVMALGLVGGLVALGFAVYVYLQITNPGLFIRKPPAPAQPCSSWNPATHAQTLIAREPSASLHFTLGNLYADQSRCGQAQQAYFQAHQLESVEPRLRLQPRREPRAHRPAEARCSISTGAPSRSRRPGDAPIQHLAQARGASASSPRSK